MRKIIVTGADTPGMRHILSRQNLPGESEDEITRAEQWPNLAYTPKPTSQPAGAITEFPLSAEVAPYGITAGPDKNLWFTERNGFNIGRIGAGA